MLLACVQPALVEEWFFRHLALRTLQGATTTRGAVLISSVMFGMAHVGAPFSIPYLTVCGLALGYVRVRAHSLALPMLMHFAHNAFVLFQPLLP